MYDICIVGGGQSGITTCKTFSEKGYNVIVLEQSENCNGMFCNIKEKDYFRWSTSSYMSGFSDFPMDTTNSWFTINDYVVYLKAYMKKFNLYKFMKYGCLVTNTRQDNDQTWEVEYNENGMTNNVLRCKKLIICTGLNQTPKYPEIVDQVDEIPIYHTQDVYYMDKQQWDVNFRNKRILLIGGAESAFDIGHLLVQLNATVYFTQKNYIEWFSTGDEPHENTERIKKIDNKCFNYIYHFTNTKHPTDTLLSYVEYNMPSMISAIWHEYGRYFTKGVRDSTCNKCIHSHDELCENTKTPNNLFSKNIVKRTEFLLDLYEEKAKSIPYPEMIDGRSIVFDGNRQEIDMIICATGYKKVFPFLSENSVKDDKIKK